MTKKSDTVPGEMRQDLLTGKWVTMAPERADKPNDFSAKRGRPKKRVKYKEDCPFCNLTDFPQDPDVLRLPDDPDKWQVHIFPNKYPALQPKDEFRSWQTGPYRAIESVGYHEILASRWHNQTEVQVSPSEMVLQLEALLLRYRQLREKAAVNYIQIIKNHGQEAGASLDHPHHQIFALPILPSDVQDILRGANEQAGLLGRNPFAVMVDFEREDGSRLVEENEMFVAWCPFASRWPFEVQVMPRYDEPYFENTDPGQLEALADILKKVLSRLYVGLNNPPYNYYLYSAPCDETGFVCDRSQFDSFRWHIEVAPRLGPWGGLELGTGHEVVTTMPEAAAAFLREQDLRHV